MPKVSIILPIYNVEPFLVECLESVVNQTLRDIEIICVNDGSTDRSLEIIQEYAAKDARIRVIDKPNSGYGDSMNKGLDIATGDYVGIVEPDDFVALDMYESLYNKAKEHDLDMIKADFYLLYGDGEKRRLSYFNIDSTNELYDKVIDLHEDMRPFRVNMQTWSGIYRRAYIEEYGIRHNTSPGASFQDNGFWFQTFAWARKVYFMHKAFYRYRQDNPNSSVKCKGKVDLIKKEYEYIYGIMQKHPEMMARLKGRFHVKKFGSYNFTLNRVDAKLKKSVAKMFAAEFREAKRKGELDESLFTPAELEMLHAIMNDPVKCYRKRFNRPSLAERLFSVRKNDTHRIIRLLGLKLKFARRTKSK